MPRNTPRSMDDLEEELCEYCDLDENLKGANCYGGEPVFCSESGHCDIAYKRYREAFENGEIEE